MYSHLYIAYWAWVVMELTSLSLDRHLNIAPPTLNLTPLNGQNALFSFFCLFPQVTCAYPSSCLVSSSSLPYTTLHPVLRSCTTHHYTSFNLWSHYATHHCTTHHSFSQKQQIKTARPHRRSKVPRVGYSKIGKILF